MTSPDLSLATVDWLSALLDSADTDVIGVANWWPRATSALQTAATAATYGQAVTTACRKLQIDVLSPRSAQALTAAEAVVGADLEAWRRIVEAEAVYIVALTRIARTSRRTKDVTP